jgi:hypothetical protein
VVRRVLPSPCAAAAGLALASGRLRNDVDPACDDAGVCGERTE